VIFVGSVGVFLVCKRFNFDGACKFKRYGG